ncbi:hypothetical protein GJ697_09900 [Pseudoduganella sp. FT25W]|uniref:TniQ domain-containing protein n=1 Tax=Duganella alba TaxID=2666081 RepID=A0A6L5QEI3_9BURK|nr:TniQ family protein [Duganella alba]MRX08145.1 hypothetical protein [Duganella alba]MRX16318.1 hypothetical protein [Duganella alba]
MLVAKPIFQPDESPLSVLLRAAAINGWKEIRHMLSVCRPLTPDIRSALSSCYKFEDYALLLGIPLPDRDVFQSVRIGGTTCRTFLRTTCRLPEWAFRAHGGAVCPACLSEGDVPYLRPIWELKIYRTCVLHGMLLVEKCSACNLSLGWKRRAPHLCECGHDLRGEIGADGDIHVANVISTKVWREDQLWLNTMSRSFKAAVDALEIVEDPGRQDDVLVALHNGGNEFEDLLKIHIKIKADILHPRIILLPFLRDNSLSNIAHKILRQSVAFSMAENSAAPVYRTLSSRDASIVLGVSEEILSVLCASDFLKFVKYSSVSRRDTPLEGICQNSCDVVLRKFWRNDVPQSIKRRTRPPIMSFKDFASHLMKSPKDCGGYDLYSGLSSLRMLGPSLKPVLTSGNEIARADFLTIKATADVLHIEIYLARNLIAKGWLTTIIDPHNPPAKLVAKSSVVKFNDWYICSTRLAKENGFKPSADFTRRLRNLGISPEGGPDVDGTKVYILRRSELLNIDFHKKNTQEDISQSPRLCESAVIDCGFQHDSISMSDAAKILSITLYKIKKLVNSGYLCRVESGSIEVRILRSSFDAFLRKWTRKGYVELSRAASMLNETKVQFIMRWVSTGFVKTLDLGLRECVRYDAVRRVRNVKESYILAPDCVRMWKVGRFTLPNLESRGLIKSTRICDGKIRLYARTDVEALLGPMPWNATG